MSGGLWRICPNALKAHSSIASIDINLHCKGAVVGNMSKISGSCTLRLPITFWHRNLVLISPGIEPSLLGSCLSAELPSRPVGSGVGCSPPVTPPHPDRHCGTRLHDQIRPSHYHYTISQILWFPVASPLYSLRANS